MIVQPLSGLGCEKDEDGKDEVADRKLKELRERNLSLVFSSLFLYLREK